MATNIIVEGHATALNIPATGKSSGDVVTNSDLSGIALTDADSDGKAIVKMPISFVAKLSVAAVGHAGNSAVAFGDKLYNDSGTYNKDATDGKPIGYALGTVVAGDTDTIEVGFAAL
jgi:predicted RecA/RadA family phage recombinase